MFEERSGAKLLRTASIFLLVVTLFGVLASAAAGQPQIGVYIYSAEVMIGWDPSDGFSDEIVVMNNV